MEAPVVPIKLASAGADGEQRRVHGRRAMDVAAHDDAARDGEEREQQQDERACIRVREGVQHGVRCGHETV